MLYTDESFFQFFCLSPLLALSCGQKDSTDLNSNSSKTKINSLYTYPESTLQLKIDAYVSCMYIHSFFSCNSQDIIHVDLQIVILPVMK